jgi:hypothetical protein
MAWPSATRGGRCWICGSPLAVLLRWLDTDAAAGDGVRDDVGAADVIAVLVGRIPWGDRVTCQEHGPRV